MEINENLIQEKDDKESHDPSIRDHKTNEETNILLRNLLVMVNRNSETLEFQNEQLREANNLNYNCTGKKVHVCVFLLQGHRDSETFVGV